MDRVGYLIRRIVEMVGVILVVAVLNFTLIHLAPGDVAQIMAGGEAGPEYVQAIRHEYGLDLPLHVQLWRYMSRFMQGDLGRSFTRGDKVVDIIMDHMPATLLLMLPSFLLGTLMGIFGGAWAARRLGSKVDNAISGFSVALYSIPVFWLGLMLIYAFSVKLRWLPSSGMMSFRPEERGLLDLIRHLVLPVFSLAIFYFSSTLKVARASVAETLREDYIMTFRAAGFKEGTVFMRHALRNALLPIVSMTGMQLAYLATGAVLTETVFSWPGIGQLMFQSILARDYPLIMGGYALMSVMVVGLSFLVDIIYVVIDPRIELK